jgi:hypothetical protein
MQQAQPAYGGSPERFPRPPGYRRRREWRRRQTARALWAGFFIQGALTGGTFYGLHLARHLISQLPLHLSATPFVVAVLAPSWLGGLAAGRLAPRLRWWQPATLGMLAAGLFLKLTAPAAALLGIGAVLRYWLATNLVLDFVLAGWIGHGFRSRRFRAGGALRAHRARS